MCEPKELIRCENKSPASVNHVDPLISTVDRIKERPFVCAFDGCIKSYTKLSHLKRHEETHGNSYLCTENGCQQYFKTKSTLKKHIDNIHLKKKPKKYKCSVCDQEFNKHNCLTRHQFKHSGVKPYVCPKEGCEKRFLVPSKLRRHLKVHEGYVCSKKNCGQKFPTWTLYVRHNATAHPTIHRCHYCEKVFTTSYNLKAHLEVHKLERDVFLCPKPNCSRFYFMKRNLTHHLKSYHEKRPFVCTEEHCYKAFKSEEDLNSHTLRHDPKKRLRKKKKRNSKPDFAARLAGCVPKKTEDKAFEKSQVNSKEAEATCDDSLEGNNDNVPYSNSMSDILTFGAEDSTQTVLCIQETMIKKKSFHVESTLISA